MPPYVINHIAFWMQLKGIIKYPCLKMTKLVTDRGTYCYEVMPFGLKNAGATYQRLVNKMFHQLIQDGTMVVYVDDLIVKSKAEDDHPQYLFKVFEVLNRYGMKLNPDKCTFGVKGGARQGPPFFFTKT